MCVIEFHCEWIFKLVFVSYQQYNNSKQLNLMDINLIYTSVSIIGIIIYFEINIYLKVHF